jgi:hypothetical protein
MNFREFVEGEVRRIPILRTRVNKGEKRKGRSPNFRAPTFTASQEPKLTVHYQEAAILVSLCHCPLNLCRNAGDVHSPLKVATTPAWSDGQSPEGRMRSFSSSPTTSAWKAQRLLRNSTRSSRWVRLTVVLRRFSACPQVLPSSPGCVALQASLNPALIKLL